MYLFNRGDELYFAPPKVKFFIYWPILMKFDFLTKFVPFEICIFLTKGMPSVKKVNSYNQLNRVS